MPIMLPSFKRQQFLLEFASIKSKCPEGIYLAPDPTDPAKWSGVFFVRGGPYSSGVLRFEIGFPSTYPETGPSITFSTEIFHPLLVPLTTYTFAAGALDPNTTPSTGDTERLSPGSFNLREAFPVWYHRSPSTERRSVKSSSIGSSCAESPFDDETRIDADEAKPSLMDVLTYVKLSFESTVLLDELPLRAAVNSNAWHAWRAHRGLPKSGVRSVSPSNIDSGRAPLSPGRNPADWNWEGVWESRVRNGIKESMSDALLFGSKTNRAANFAMGPIRFAKNDDEETIKIEESMLRALGMETT